MCVVVCLFVVVFLWSVSVVAYLIYRLLYHVCVALLSVAGRCLLLVVCCLVFVACCA